MQNEVSTTNPCDFVMSEQLKHIIFSLFKSSDAHNEVPT